MRKYARRGLSLALALVLCLGLASAAWAVVDVKDLQSNIQETASRVTANVPEPEPGSVSGDWLIVGLARSGVEVPEGYYAKYYAAVEKTVKEHQGLLDRTLITDNDRIILALSALGKDARDVAGYDLTLPLGDFELTCKQGLNGPIWALITLDCKDYPVPKTVYGGTQATRQMYIDRVLACQLPDGGWNLRVSTPEDAEKQNTSNEPVKADPDMTAMALQALSKYLDQSDVYDAVERGLVCLSLLQDKKGGFSSWGNANSESTAQVIVALCELGMALDNPQFIKNGFSLLDNLLSFRTSEGYFCHVKHGGADGMATEQAMYALAAVVRAQSGKNSLYRMGDAVSVSLESAAVEERAPGTGLAGKDPAVQSKAVTKPGITFTDIKASPNKEAIEALASREIINGMGDDRFAPENTMTRAQFATIVVKALGLTPKANSKFKDVAASAWYAPYVGTANSFGIVNGISDTEFNPEGNIKRQEAAVMVARAAKLCGLDTTMSETDATDVLCVYYDYRTIASWAKEAMAWCVENELVDTDVARLEPSQDILRGEIAEMLYRMLGLANLL